MRIGIDFDNTIVCYDPLFYELGVSKGLIPANCAANKFAIRAHLSKTNRMKDWTALQVEIYGREIWRADAFPGFFKFLRAVAEINEIYIISHKTRYSAIDPQIDLHEPARNWLKCHDVEQWIPNERVFFLPSRHDKARRIAQLSCDIFIDDLNDMFDERGFPAATMGILFDPNQAHPDSGQTRRALSWRAIEQMIANGLNV